MRTNSIQQVIARLVITGLTATALGTVAATAHASAGTTVERARLAPTGTCSYVVADKWLTDRESDYDVDTGVQIQNHDTVHLSTSGSIWAGVWFTGTNGPDGWVGWHAGNDFPLPGSAPFSQLAKTAEDGYFFIGSGRQWEYLNDTLGPGQTRLYLRINDNVPGNGNGAFTVHVQVLRPC